MTALQRDPSSVSRSPGVALAADVTRNARAHGEARARLVLAMDAPHVSLLESACPLGAACRAETR